MAEELSPEEIADHEASEQIRRTVETAKEQEKIFGHNNLFENEYVDNNYDAPELTEKEINFIEHFMVYQNPSAAIVHAGIQSQFSRRTAMRILQKESAQRFLKSLILEARRNVGLTLEQHLRALADIRDRASAKGDNKTALGAERSRGEAAGFYTRLSAYEMKLVEQSQAQLEGPEKPPSQMTLEELQDWAQRMAKNGVAPPKVLDVDPEMIPPDEEIDFRAGTARSFFGNRKAAGVINHSRTIQRGIADGLEPYKPQTEEIM